MRGRVILACEMIEDELGAALSDVPTQDRPHLAWVESGLHDQPERLRDHLQSLIDRLDEGASSGQAVVLPSVRPGPGPGDGRREEIRVPPAREVLLAFGFCGKALLGLRSRRLSMTFPRVDDCISLFLNRGCTREDIERDARTFYLTRGWLTHFSQFSQYFDEWVQRYGVAKAAHLRRVMFAGYERIGLIDTGAFDVAGCLEESCSRAADIGVAHEVVSGSSQLLERMLAGERDSEIVLLEPGETLTYLHLLEGREAAGCRPLDRDPPDQA